MAAVLVARCLLRSRERWRSIVMRRLCVCVCLSVCPQAYRPNHTREVTKYFVHVAYRRGSISSGGVTNPKERGNFGSFYPHWQYIVQHSIWDTYKTAEPIEMPFGMMTRVGSRYHVLDGDQILKGKRQFFGENVAAHCKVMGRSTVRTERCKNGWTDRDAVLEEDSVGPKSHVLDGVQIPRGRGQFSGVSGLSKSNGNLRCSGRFIVAAAFADRCKSDRSIAINAMQQKGSFSMPGKHK